MRGQKYNFRCLAWWCTVSSLFTSSSAFFRFRLFLVPPLHSRKKASTSASKDSDRVVELVKTRKNSMIRSWALSVPKTERRRDNLLGEPVGGDVAGGFGGLTKVLRG